MQDLANDLPRIPLPRTPVNKGMKKGRGVVPRPSATGRLTGELVVVEWTAIDVLAPLLFGDDRSSYVPSAAKGTVTRRKPPNITGALGDPWGSKRGHRHSHHHRRQDKRQHTHHQGAA